MCFFMAGFAALGSAMGASASAATAVGATTAISAATTAATLAASYESAQANKKAIDQADVQRGKELQEQGSDSMNQVALQARQARSRSIAAAAGAGINTGSNSFLATLQTTAMTASEKSQIDLENEQNGITDNDEKAQSELNSKASSPTFLGAFADLSASVMQGYTKGGGFGSPSSTPMVDSGPISTGAGTIAGGSDGLNMFGDEGSESADNA